MVREQRRTRLGVEALEDRSVPAIYTWDGGAAFTNHWTAGNNWVGNQAPQPGDDLVFPAAAGRRATNINDFPAGTSFHSITFTGGGYVLNGNRILLGSTSATNLDGVFNSTGNNTIALPLQLAGSPGTSVTNEIPFSVTTDTLTVGAVISGNSPLTSLSKQGNGTLVLGGPNTYLATTLVGRGVLRVTDDHGLGAASGVTNGLGGATLDLQGVTIRNETVTLAGDGVAIGTIGFGITHLGALHASGLSALLASPGAAVLLANDATIRVDPNSALTVENLAGPSGSDEGGSAGPIPVDLSTTGTGTLVLTGSNAVSVIDYAAREGRLEFIGDYTSGSVTVFNGAQLTGTGTAPGTTVNSGGRVNPGATVNGSLTGRLTLNGDTVLEPGSFLDLELTDTTTFSDRIKVNGTS